ANAQRVYVTATIAQSLTLAPTTGDWKRELTDYIEDASRYEEDWTAELSVVISKRAIADSAGLDPKRHRVVPVFLQDTLKKVAAFPIPKQLEWLFPEQDRKTVLLLLESAAAFADGPFLSITDGDHVRNVTYSEDRVAAISETREPIGSECSWQG